MVQMNSTLLMIHMITQMNAADENSNEVIGDILHLACVVDQINNATIKMIHGLSDDQIIEFALPPPLRSFPLDVQRHILQYHVAPFNRDNGHRIGLEHVKQHDKSDNVSKPGRLPGLYIDDAVSFLLNPWIYHQQETLKQTENCQHGLWVNWSNAQQGLPVPKGGWLLDSNPSRFTSVTIGLLTRIDNASNSLLDFQQGKDDEMRKRNKQRRLAIPCMKERTLRYADIQNEVRAELEGQEKLLQIKWNWYKNLMYRLKEPYRKALERFKTDIAGAKSGVRDRFIQLVFPESKQASRIVWRLRTVGCPDQSDG